MNISLEYILGLEAANTNSIHMHQYPGSEQWTVYDQSALNLIELVPELKTELKEEVFPEYEIRLYCVQIDSATMERYGLPYHCMLLSDYYIELQKTPVTELKEEPTECFT